MSMLVSITLPISIKLVIVYILKKYFECFLEKKSMPTAVQISVYVAVLSILSFSFILCDIPEMNLISSIVSFLFISYLFKGGIKRKLVLGIYAYFLHMDLELTILILQNHFNIPNNPKLFGFISFVPLYIAVLLIKRIYCKKQILNSSYNWYLMFTINAGSIYIIYETYVWVNIHNNWNLSVLILVVIIYIINFTIFHLYNKLLTQYNESIKTEQIKNYMSYFELQKEEKEKLRYWRHDINNYLLSVSIMIENGCYKEALSILQSKIDALELIRTVEYSGNLFVDCIINYKARASACHNIKIVCDCVIPDELNIPGDDLSIILGNSLDNAIEACIDLEYSPRIIHIKLSYDRGVFLYVIKNKYNKIRQRGRKFISTKSDHINHGLGIDNIQTIVSKYNGGMTIETKDNLFTMSIILVIS